LGSTGGSTLREVSAVPANTGLSLQPSFWSNFMEIETTKIAALTPRKLQKMSLRGKESILFSTGRKKY
jgi:hypothetical protein